MDLTMTLLPLHLSASVLCLHDSISLLAVSAQPCMSQWFVRMIGERHIDKTDLDTLCRPHKLKDSCLQHSKELLGKQNQKQTKQPQKKKIMNEHFYILQEVESIFNMHALPQEVYGRSQMEVFSNHYRAPQHSLAPQMHCCR